MLNKMVYPSKVYFEALIALNFFVRSEKYTYYEYY
jgi:hypothetical protein